MSTVTAPESTERVHFTQLALANPAPSAFEPGGKSSNDAGTVRPFGDDGLTFLDFLDIINPLQHIPLISNLYRNYTGDTIDPASRVAGGAVFGGPIGAAVSMLNVIFKESTGKDMGDHVLALFEEGENKPGGSIDIASADIKNSINNETELGETVGAVLNERNATESARSAFVTSAAPLSPASPPINSLNSAETKKVPAAPGLAHRPPLAPTYMPTRLALAPESLEIFNTGGGPYQDAGYMNGSITQPKDLKDIAPNSVPGAIAQEGGWFTAAMLSAMKHYEAGDQLARPATKATAVDQRY